MNEILIASTAATLGVMLGITIGIYISVRFIKNMAKGGDPDAQDAKQTIDKAFGKRGEAQFFGQMSDEEAELQEDNSAARHKELVKQLPKDDYEQTL